MPDVQEAKCFEFTVQILPPPLEAPSRGQKNVRPPRFISVYALVYKQLLILTTCLETVKFTIF